MTESVLNDPEDLVVIENIKMLSQFARLKLINKKQSLKTLETLLPLLLHPNRVIRHNVAIYITTLTKTDPKLNDEEEKKEEESNKIIVKRQPLFAPEEFYCFIRPKILIYAANQSDELTDIEGPKDILKKLRPPLSLKIMHEYFKELSSLEMSTAKDREIYQQRELEFSKTHAMSDSDTFAFAFLCGNFKEKLIKMRNKNLFMLPPPSGKEAQTVPTVPSEQFIIPRRVEVPQSG